MTKIKSITVSNLKAISDLSINFEGATAIITAGNNKGKTSFLKSHIERLQSIKVGSILKQNESEGFSEIELTSGEKFVWTFNDKGKEKLTYVSEKNIPGAVTKEISKVYFPATFDVDEFLHSAPAKQKAVLQKLTGIDFTEIDKKLTEAVEARKWANKVEQTEKAKLTHYDPKLPKEPLPVDELQTELNGIEAHNLKAENVAKGISDRSVNVIELTNEIAELEAKIKLLDEKRTKANNEIEQGNAWLKVPANQVKENADELKTKIAEIVKKNSEIETNNLALKQQQAYDKSIQDAADADIDVKKIEAEKLDVIKNASMPEGFGFSDEGVTYEGFEYNKESLSSSRIYIGALKLAALGLGEVKTLYFDASYLDNNSLSEIEQWATKQGLQLLIELPDRSGGPIEYQLIQS